MDALGEDDKPTKIAIAETLLKLANTNPIVTYNEETYLIDSTMIEKILALVHPNEKYTSIAYQKIKQLSLGTSIIAQSSSFLK